MTAISATTNAIGAALRKIGDILDPSPLASHMKGIGNVTARAASSSVPMAKSDARRVSRGDVGKDVSGQTRSTRTKNIARLTSSDDGDNHDGATANAADDTESIASAAAKSKHPQTPLGLNDCKENFERDKLLSLFEAAGKNKDKLELLFATGENSIAIHHLNHIATIYHTARTLGPSSDAMNGINDAMTKLTEMMVADGLGRKSVFGSYQLGKKAGHVKVKNLENKLLMGLATISGKGAFAAGNMLRAQCVGPFIKAYIEQKPGILLTPEQSEKIDDLLDDWAKMTWGNVHDGMQAHQTDEIEKICRIIDMVLTLPNLLGQMSADRIKEKLSSETATLEQQPKPKPLTTGTDEHEINPATVHSGDNQEKTNGPPNPGQYNINIYDFSTRFTYSPVDITYRGKEKSDSKKSHTERVDAATNTDRFRLPTQDKYEIDVGPQPMFAEVVEQDIQNRIAKMFGRLETISIVVPRSQVAKHISPPVLWGTQTSLEAILPQEQKATVSTQAVEIPLNTAQSETIATRRNEALSSTVIHSQPLTAQAPQYAAPLSKAQELPLYGISRTMADNKRFADITGSPVSRAQVRNVPPSDRDQRDSNDEDALRTGQQTSSTVLKGPQPVVLTNQGRQLSQLPRVEPKVKHFAPSNMKREDLTVAKRHLKQTGVDYLSPPVEAIKLQADGGAETRARTQQLSRAVVAQMMAQDMQAPQSADTPAIPTAETKAVPPSKPSVASTTEPPVSQPAVADNRVMLSAAGLRRSNRTHGTSGVKHFVPMDGTPEVVPTLANDKTNYMSKRLAAYKPGANDIKEDGKS
ncbi:hypothetical protein GTU79_25400 [Sodalis ligni]|uniref:hypothetical protein n=1 Tax=Sodalis ligni TaxID=2697027 RepID=UPI001BDDE1A7|nr:hypothetical protein [Sodalis ligni]QWA10500.1 hypothetical protein GTU79_25400 [Sodalis ligni]